MSQMEVIRSEGPLKKDWEVYLHTAQTVMDEDKIVIKELEDESDGLVVEKELEFDEGGIRLKMRGCTFGQMTKRAEQTIGRFLGTEMWTTLWNGAVEAYENRFKVERYYEIGVSFSVRDEGRVYCWQKNVTESIKIGGLWTPTGVARRAVDEREGMETWVTLECLRVPMTEEEKVVAVKARALGMMRIYRRVPYGDAKTQELCLEKMIEYIADGVMGKEEDEEEEE